VVVGPELFFGTSNFRKKNMGGDIMKKRSLLLLLSVVFLCLVILTACSNSDQSAALSEQQTDGSSQQEEKSINIRWGNVFAPEMPFNQGTRRFKELVETESNGRITVDLFPGAQLGNNNELMGMLTEGTNQMGNEGGGFLAQWAPKFLVSEAVYAFRDIDHMLKVMNSEIGQEMFDQLLESRGVRVIDVWYYGTRHISAKKLINTPEDLQGVKMRVPDGPLYIENGKALGANPTPMTLSEVYMALHTGVIDAQENPLPTIYQNKFHEVQDYIILTGHNYNFNVIMVNEEFWNSLSKSDQDLIVRCVKEAGEYQKQIALQEEEALISIFQEEGITIHTPDIEAFKTRAREHLVRRFASEWGEGFYESIQNF